MALAERLIQAIAQRAGLTISRSTTLAKTLPIEASAGDKSIIEKVDPFTMTSWGRLWALLESVRYAEEAKIPGAFVECGVWRGGSVMAMAYKLLELDGATRDLWLYDTFKGMTTPTSADIDATTGVSAASALAATAVGNGDNIWCVAGLADVKANVSSTRYPTDRVTYVEGDVATTLLDEMPDQIAILRLDTDWYESTKMELEVLYPRLAQGGICILDDYGHWEGARAAVDEYFVGLGTRPYMHPIDYSGRVFIKTH